MAMRHLPALCLLLFLSFLSPCSALDHEYLLHDSDNFPISQLATADVVNLELLSVVQIQIMNPNGTLWTVQNVRARTGPSGSWTALAGYKTTHSGSSNPYAVFRAAASGSPLNVDLASQYSSLGYTQFMFETRPAGSPTFEEVVFYVTLTTASMCSLTQAGSTSSEVCQNGGTCVPDIIGSYCTCPVGFEGSSCADCADTFTGPGCAECVAGYFGPDCATCPPCVNGTCVDGISGDGSCECFPGFSGDLCTECVLGFTGLTCSECSFGFYGAGCTACPDCGPYGTCNDGLSGNGTCECETAWVSADGGYCNECAPGYYGEACEACPSCGHGSCSDGLTGTGACNCDAGWTTFLGGTCTACAPGFFGENCEPCPDCGSNGYCDEGVIGDFGGTGACLCHTGWESSGGTCNVCAAGYFGPSCAACPDCGSHGSCSDSIDGTGICECSSGWVSNNEVCDSCAEGFFGESCEPCPDCGLRGSCDQGVSGDTAGTGECVCQDGWVSHDGGFCNACDDNHFGAECQNCPDCGHGECSQGVSGDTAGTGECNCEPGWANSELGFCTDCADGYFGPDCAPCPEACGPYGSCSSGILGTGECVCQPGFTNYGGGFCNACAEGYYSPRCIPCPECGGGGICDEGVPGDLGGSGTCVCATGWANGAGYCDVCAPGFTGDDCSQCLPGFYGSQCTPCPDCGYFGTCNDGITGDGACTCADGWASFGGHCNVCHPSRTGIDCDQCAEGYYGAACSPCPDCLNGVCSDGPTGDGTCQCDAGFALASGVCGACAPGRHGPDCLECPSCGGLGVCDEGITGTGQCQCPTGWASTPEHACSICAPGYYGRDCVRCPVCGPHGICDEGLTQTGTCNCDLGWTHSQGSFCNVCQTGFTGPNCTQCVVGTYPNCYNPIPCPNGCSGHGQCNLRTGVCACDSRFKRADCGACVVQTDTYPACSRPVNCPSNCSNNGYCDYSTGTCACNAGFTPPGCDSCLPGYVNFPNCYLLMECSTPCEYGTCNNRTGTCDCPPHYEGTTCGSCAPGFENPSEGCWERQPCINDCNNRGTCNHFNGTCQCDYSYYGPACESQQYCLINPCQNGGTCTPTEDYYECDCHPDHAGHDCQYWNLTPVIASVTPLTGSWNGGSLVVIGTDFEAPLTVVFSYGSYRHEEVVTEFQTIPTKKRSTLMGFEVPFPDVDFIGYVLITIVNPGGDSVSFEEFYITDLCPDADQYAFNGTCMSCPPTATCPGGARLWPLPGFWSSDEFSLPFGCPLPSNRCLGGRHSTCATGYRGELCRFCVDGYQSDATGACVACPATGCYERRPLSTAVYFLFIWIGVILVLAIAYTGIRIRNKKQYKKKMISARKEARLSRRVSRGITVPLKLSDYSQVDTDLAAPSPFSPHAGSDEDEEEEDVPLAPLRSDLRSRPLKAIGKKATFSLPSSLGEPVSASTSFYNDVEAIILDRTVRTAPSKETLYNQVLKTAQPDLTLARMANQVTKQVVKAHEKEIMIFDDKGRPVGLVDELEIQKLVEKYIDSICWRVVGQVNALSKGFAQNPLQRHPFDLPYFVQFADEIGPRPTAHNRWVAQLYANELMGMGLHPNLSILGVYSGFGGSLTAEYVARHLHVNLLKNENFKRNPYTALVEAFMQTDEGYSEVVRKGKLSDIVGCTATLCMVRGYELWFSWVGNCRAVLFKSTGEVIDFCEPQTPERDSEKERLEARGGVIKKINGQDRLNGVYPISRAFGCPRMKQYLIPEPEIVTYDLQGDEDYLVIAPNAFWAAVRDDDLAEILAEYEGAHVAGLADSLAAYARSLGVLENITVCVMGFSE